MKISKIISGGQTGVDRAAFDVAIELGIPHEGWVPNGRIAEDGPIGSQYKVQETPSHDYAQRTEWNVRDSDATLIISRGHLTGGSQLTQQLANKINRPLLHIDLSALSIPDAIDRILQWLVSIQCSTLNVAGPRASEDSEIYQRTRTLLTHVLLNRSSDTFKTEIDTALKIYEQTLCNFRHWDQIRWLVPYWFATLAAIGATTLNSVDTCNEPFIRIGLGVFGAFSLLCLHLLYRLMVYHNKDFSDLTEKLSDLLPSGSARTALLKTLPFSLDIKGLPSTSTFWFMIFILLLGVASIALSMTGLFWLTTTVKCS